MKNLTANRPMPRTEAFLCDWVKRGFASHVALALGDHEGEKYRFLYAESGKIDGRTLFDMMSVTKILSVATLFQIGWEKGLVRLEDTLGDWLGNVPADKKEITLAQLLTHTSGILRRVIPDYLCPARRAEAADFLLSFPLAFAPGTRYEYSCGGFVLLGFVLEKAFNAPLDWLFDFYVARPLGMRDTGFNPREDNNIVPGTATPYEGYNKVSDPIARRLYGVAGNAGIFSTVDDMSRFSLSLLRHHEKLMSEDAFRLATVDQAPFADEVGRAYGYGVVDARYEQGAGLYADGAIGHTGFSGTEAFADFAQDFYCTSLSNTSYCAIATRDFNAKTRAFRIGLHTAIREDLA